MPAKPGDAGRLEADSGGKKRGGEGCERDGSPVAAGKLSDDEWKWLNCQDHIVDYLYGLWMGNDTDLTEEFAEIIHTEIVYDMEEHGNE